MPRQRDYVPHGVMKEALVLLGERIQRALIAAGLLDQQGRRKAA
jgi:hypothetical protein